MAAPARLALVLAVALAVLAACARPAPPARPPDDMPRQQPGYALWVEPPWAAAQWSSPAATRDSFALLASRGVNRVFLPLKDNRGVLAMGADGATSESLSAWARRAATATGVELVFVYPFFLGEPSQSDRAVAVYLDPETGGAALRMAQPLSPFPRTSPASSAARDRELAQLRRVVPSLGDASLAFSHIGFEGPHVDFSTEARRAFEGAIGRTIQRWPGEVVGFDTAADGTTARVRGPLWDAWMAWRASLVRGFAFDAETAVRETLGSRPHLVLVTQGYYPMHPLSGENWAHWRAPAAAGLSDVPPGYEDTAFGALFDEVVLLASAPLPDAADTVEQGFAWWASVEGAGELSRRMLAPDIRRTVAIPPAAYAPDGTIGLDGRERLLRAITGARAQYDGVLVIGAESVDRLGLWDTLAAATR